MIELNQEDFGTLACCAIRYCQGRQTYMPAVVREIVKAHISNISDNDLKVMLDDCDFQEAMNMYGNERIDKPGWIEWRKILEDEIKRREEDD